MVHEEDSTFRMDKIRTSILDSEPEPGRERANLIRVKLEPKMEEDHPGLIQSDRITTNVESQNGSMHKQEGIPYIAEDDEILLPLNTQMLEVPERDIIPLHRQ